MFVNELQSRTPRLTGADIDATKNEDMVKKALNMQWTPNIHHLYSKETRIQIATILKLTRRNTELGQLPKETLLHVCGYVAARPQITLICNEPVKKKQKVNNS